MEYASEPLVYVKNCLLFLNILLQWCRCSGSKVVLSKMLLISYYFTIPLDPIPFAGLVFCFMGDYFMCFVDESTVARNSGVCVFKLGMFCFTMGHMMYILSCSNFYFDPDLIFRNVSLSFFIMVLLWDIIPNNMKLEITVYSLILTMLRYVYSLDLNSYELYRGAYMFTVSDIFLAISIFANDLTDFQRTVCNTIVTVLYFESQWLILNNL